MAAYTTHVYKSVPSSLQCTPIHPQTDKSGKACNVLAPNEKSKDGLSPDVGDVQLLLHLSGKEQSRASITTQAVRHDKH